MTGIFMKHAEPLADIRIILSENKLYELNFSGY